MNCVRVLAIAGLGLGHANGDVARRLQEQQSVQLRRLNAWDDIEDIFIDLGDIMIDIGDVFVDGWEDIDEFFTEDMVEWFEEDFVDFWVAFGTANEVMIEEFADVTADAFTDGWDDLVTGVEAAWEWTENAAVTAWEYSEDLFNSFECLVQDWTGFTCIDCVEEACNETLDQETIDNIDVANELAMMDMDDEFDTLFEGCAAAMEKCPSLADCQALHELPDSTKQFVASTIGQCILCYACLPYGSTKETCQMALNQVMPNECEGCSETYQQFYVLFYSCSSLKTIHDSITLLGETYEEGASGHESLDQICKYCKNCSDYTSELWTTCSDWALISSETDGWDCEPPEVPDVLVLEGTVVGVDDHDTTDGSTTSGTADTPEPTAAPTPSPTQAPTPSPTQAPTPSPTRRPTDAASDDSSAGSTGGRRPRPERATPSPTPYPTPSRPQPPAGGRPGSDTQDGGRRGRRRRLGRRGRRRRRL